MAQRQLDPQLCGSHSPGQTDRRIPRQRNCIGEPNRYGGIPAEMVTCYDGPGFPFLARHVRTSDCRPLSPKKTRLRGAYPRLTIREHQRIASQASEPSGNSQGDYSADCAVDTETDLYYGKATWIGIFVPILVFPLRRAVPPCSDGANIGNGPCLERHAFDHLFRST